MNISIKDRPIEKASQDQLKVTKYANALVHFILKSDTPITIGLQGEWGTGKTSLMYMLREALDSREVATSWVNTWEYSMFRGANETTPAVLNGLVLKLRENCGKLWTLKDETENKIKKIGKFFGAISNQIIANQTGVDVKDAYNETASQALNIIEIAEIKSDISDLINKLIEDPNNDYKRVVFFVDDLDRIQPSDAVEILEALKNIFDIPHCIFVLAIDYEVVVKGLEGKFGKKTEENEREFRSFFDKIIQVPFSMPTGAYDIDNFLDEKLKELGMNVPDKLKLLYLDAVKNSVGYNPRSLKRFINTFSLLNSIRKADEPPNNRTTEEDNEFMLFVLLGIQITYPKIFRILGMSLDFTSWNQAFAARLGLDWNWVNEKVKEYGENPLVDEDWEKVVWGICQSDNYLKSKVFCIIELLNALKSHFTENLEDSIQIAMEFAAITSVDDSHDAKQNIIQIGEKRIRFTGLDAKRKQLEDWKCHPEAISLWSKILFQIQENLDSIGAKINFAKTATSFYRWQNGKGSKEIQTLYCDNPKNKYPGLKLVYYGYSTEFVSDIFKIAKDFGWPAEESDLIKNGKIDFVAGAGLAAPDAKWILNTHGSLWINYELHNSVGAEKAEQFILEVNNKMIERLKLLAG